MKKNLIHILIFLVFVTVLPAQNDPQIQSRKNLAELFVKSGQLARAKEIYKELVNLQPWNFENYASLNNILLKLKEYDESISLLTSKIENTPNDPGYYGLLGSTYHTMGEYDKAFEIWDKGISVNNNSESNIRLMVNFAVQNRAFDKAVEYLRKGKEISKNPIGFSLQLGNYLLTTMKFKEGADEYCEILKHTPSQMGSVKSRFQRYLSREQAYEAFVESVEEYYQKTDMPIYLELLSFIYSYTKQNDKALETLVKFEEETKSNGMKIYNFANSSFLGKNYDVSLNAYKYLIDNYVNSTFYPESRLGYTRSKHFKLIDKHKNINSWKPLNAKDTSGAHHFDEILKSYYDLFEKNKRISYKIEILYEIGKIFEDVYFDYARADSIYKQIVSLNKNIQLTNETISRLVTLSIKNNNLDEAKNYAEKLIERKRSSANHKSFARFIKSKIFFWKGDVDSSLSKLNEITSNLSDNYSNNAIELSIIQNSLKKDSMSLNKFAKADMLIEQQKYKEAKILLNELKENQNLFLIADAVKYKLAEINIATDSFDTAEILLNEISEKEMPSAYADKSLFLLGNLYLNGYSNKSQAKLAYQKLLENFPNSLYFDRSRQILNSLGENSI